MNRVLATTVQIFITVFGISIFAFLLWFPTIEGRNINSSLYQVYFNDPFLIYAYVSSLPFFVGLWQMYKLVELALRNHLSTEIATKSFQIIKYCTKIFILFVLGGEAYIFAFVRGTDDIAGGVGLGICLILASLLVLVAITISQRKLQYK